MQSVFLAADEVEVVTESGSPVMTITFFLLVLIGAVGYFVYTENQKRATAVGAAGKVRQTRRKLRTVSVANEFLLVICSRATNLFLVFPVRRRRKSPRRSSHVKLVSSARKAVCVSHTASSFKRSWSLLSERSLTTLDRFWLVVLSSQSSKLAVGSSYVSGADEPARAHSLQRSSHHQ
jgi:hypothetical protein